MCVCFVTSSKASVVYRIQLFSKIYGLLEGRQVYRCRATFVLHPCDYNLPSGVFFASSQSKVEVIYIKERLLRSESFYFGSKHKFTLCHV